MKQVRGVGERWVFSHVGTGSNRSKDTNADKKPSNDFTWINLTSIIYQWENGRKNDP